MELCVSFYAFGGFDLFETLGCRSHKRIDPIRVRFWERGTPLPHLDLLSIHRQQHEISRNIVLEFMRYMVYVSSGFYELCSKRKGPLLGGLGSSEREGVGL
ncbi:hypothetical protein Leryth_026343 [Lithospermum erythrorhizon]|nr:hypothetical protein Leryth_026343 [Lithospermum erythrorhizon]